MLQAQKAYRFQYPLSLLPQILNVPCSQHNPTIKATAEGGEREGAQTDTMGLFIGAHTRGSAAKKPRPHSQKPSRPIPARPRVLEKASDQKAEGL